MQPGKLPPELLNRVIFPYLGAKRQDVLVSPGIGQDCSLVDFGSELAVLSSDPITASGHHLGYLAVHVSANDIAATGAEPVGLLLTLLLPPGTSQDEIEAIMQEIHAAAGSLNMAVLGGHTEFTNAVCQPVAAVTALGRATKGRYITAAGGRPGDTLLLTKTAGCEGTAILASDLYDKLEAALGADLVRRAREFIKRISVVPEGRIAAAHGASAMHDVTEGGVLGAAAELAAASGCGVELWAERVPVAPETAAICELLDLNPLGLIGSGSLLIASSAPEAVEEALKDHGIPVAPIGRLLAREEGLWLTSRGERQPLIVPPRDELYRAITGA